MPPTWPWLIGRDQAILLELLAHALAFSVNTVHYRHEKTTPARVRAGDRLVAKTLDLDIGKWWRADKQFLSQLTKPGLLAALAEAGRGGDSHDLERASKADLVAAVERKLAGSAWLPQALLCTADASTGETPDSETAEFGKTAE